MENGFKAKLERIASSTLMRRFLSIRGQLLTLAALVLSVFLLSTVFTFENTRRISAALTPVISQELPGALYEGELNVAVNTVAFWLQNAASNVSNEKLKAAAFAQVDNAVARHKAALAKLKSIEWTNPDEKTYIDWIDKESPNFEKYVAEAKATIKSYTGKEADAAEKMHALTEDTLLQQLGNFQAPLETLNEFHKNAVTESAKSFETARSTIKMTTFLIGGFGSVLCILCCFFIGMRVSKNLQSFSEHLQGSSSHLIDSASGLLDSSNALTISANSNWQSLLQTSSSLEQISSTIKVNASTAELTSQASANNVAIVKEGRKTVSEALNAIQNVQLSSRSLMDQISHNRDDLAKINQVINRITEQAKVINDIVFQTRLLAFNAAVEAARAGQQGAGFAVVADEVGKLAAHTGKAAQSISAMLDESAKQIDAIISGSQARFDACVSETNQQIDKSLKVTGHCDQLFDQILSEVTKIDQLARQIAEASQRQSEGVVQLTGATQLVKDKTTDSLKRSEEICTSTSGLRDRSFELSALANELEALMTGRTKSDQPGGNSIFRNEDSGDASDRRNAAA